MGYGLQIVGSSGVTQIDQDYTNLGLVTKGTMSWSALAGNTLTLPSIVAPVLAIQTTTPVWIYSDGALPNTTFTFYGTTAGSCTYFLFDKMNTAPADAFGLEIYKADGTLAYHSGWQVMRIGNVGTVPNATIVNPGTAILSVAAPYSSTWAAALLCYRFNAHMVSGSQHVNFFDTLTCDNTGAVVTPQQVGPIGGTYATDQPNGGMVLLIDVAGF